MKKTGLIYVAIILILLILSFAINSALLYVVCWAFGFNFSWKLSLGVYCVLAILRTLFSKGK